MSKLATILSALLALVSAETDGSCLLTLRSDLNTAPSPDQMTWAERHKLLLAWTKEHAAVSAAATKAKEKSDRMISKQPAGLQAGGELDMTAFIEQQKASSDSCYSKHLEVKRTLDGLHQKVDILSNEVTSNDAIIQAQAKIVMDKNDEKTEADAEHDRDIEECNTIRDEDQKQVDQFQKELDELTNIANPAVRSKIKFDTNMSQEIKQHVDTLKENWEANNDGHLDEETHNAIVAEALASGGSAMLQTREDVLKSDEMAAINKSIAEMNDTQCQKVVDFLQASSRVNSQIIGVESCDQQRENLQKTFAEAFIQLTELREKTAQRNQEAHEDCIALANGKKDEAHERLDSTIQESTNAINRAQEILNALNPLWIDAKKGLKKVQDHMAELEDACAKEDDVSEHLQRVRDLIMSLEKCPGRHDYMLQMPEGAEF